MTRARKGGMLAIVGPGVLVAATGVGAGDLATAGIAGSKLGLAVLWTILLGAFVKFVLTEGLARWQLATGTTLVEGAIERLGVIAGAVFVVYLIPWTFFTCGALVSAAGVAGDALVPVFEPVTRDDGTVINTGKIVFGAVQSLIGLTLVWVGGFRLFERVMTVCVGVMFIAVVAAAALTGPDLVALLKGIFVPTIPDARGEGLSWTIALMGGVGGTVTILCYGYWIREQGRETTDDLKTCRLDLATGYLVTALFGVATLVIAAGVQVDGRGATLLIVLAERLQETIGGAAGSVARWVFLVGCWSAIFSSLLGVWQAVPYLFADLWRIGSRKLAGLPCASREPVDTKGRPYRAAMVLIATVPAAQLLVSFSDAQLYYTLVGAAFIPMLALALLVMNSRSAWIGCDARSGPLTVAVLVLALALSGLAGWFSAQKTWSRLRPPPAPAAAPASSSTPG